MRIRRSALGHARVFMLVGLARVVSAQTPDSVDTRTASATAQTPEAGVPAARSLRGGVQDAVKSVRSPAPLGVDGQLTSWLQVRGEFRARIEGFTGGGFAADNSRTPTGWIASGSMRRSRPTKSMKFVVQVQDARAFDKTTGSQAAPFRDTLDLRMAYGEFGSTNTVRVGRQELAFGEQRLIGISDWANTARTFDGARATLKRKGVQLDAFAASVVTIQPDAFDKSGNGNGLFGAYVSSTTVVPKQTLEPYLLLAAVAWTSPPSPAASPTSIRRRPACGWRASCRRPSTTRREIGRADRIGRRRRRAGLGRPLA